MTARPPVATALATASKANSSKPPAPKSPGGWLTFGVPAAVGGVATGVAKLATGGTGSASTTNCLVPLPIPGIGGCLLTKSEGKALVGGFLVIGGGSMMAFGLLVLAAYGLGNTQSAKGLAGVGTYVPGPAGVAARAARGGQQKVSAKHAERKAVKSSTRPEAPVTPLAADDRPPTSSKERRPGGGRKRARR